MFVYVITIIRLKTVTYHCETTKGISLFSKAYLFFRNLIFLYVYVSSYISKCRLHKMIWGAASDIRGQGNSWQRSTVEKMHHSPVRNKHDSCLMAVSFVHHCFPRHCLPNMIAVYLKSQNLIYSSLNRFTSNSQLRGNVFIYHT